MLLQFKFENFRSFRDETILDMTATKITEHQDHLVKLGREKVLPVAGIFGANASGKSNVIDAFNYMTSYVIYSFGYGDETSPDSIDGGFMEPEPFRFDAASQDGESCFEVYFTNASATDEKTYNYGFAVDSEGVCEEWLNTIAKSPNSKPRRVFYRNREQDELDLVGIPQKSRENIKLALDNKALVVSLGAKLRITKLKLVRSWFMDNEFADFGRPYGEFFAFRQVPDDFIDDVAVQRKVVDYFNSFDPSIIGFEIEPIEKTGANKQTVYRIAAVHKMVSTDGTSTIPLEDESAGTLKMFALYGPLQRILRSGGVLVIDEINARLHSHMVRVFVLAFLNKSINTNNAQLLFTSHDVQQLNAGYLRRDEIWFTEKSADGLSTLFSLADFVDAEGGKIRKDENHEKNYLLGKYGAIPTLRNLDMLTEE
jgi:AAA15 family ATPase/GTPase